MNLRTLVIIAAAAAASLSAVAQTTTSWPRQNKELFNDACVQAADTLLLRSGVAKRSIVELRMQAGERTQYFRSVIVDAVSSHCGAVFAEGTAADSIITTGVEDASIGYSETFRERWLGEKKTARTASVTLRLEVQQRSTGRLLYTGTMRVSETDTIAVDEIAQLSSSSRQIAVGEAPRPSIWEKLLEPAILTVSSGIAIYLFFTVRG